jgi:FtsP/CotA-like multicopper oxidase with cupredoxin domain
MFAGFRSSVSFKAFLFLHVIANALVVFRNSQTFTLRVSKIKSEIFVNGVSPGPALNVLPGDRIVATVYNDFTDGEAISIHWHGMLQQGSNAMDGVPFVTQAPILPGQSFTYDFVANFEPGTFWYHAYSSAQYMRGLRGPLIVQDASESTIYSDTALVLSDFFDADESYLVDQYLATSTTGGKTPAPFGALINGINQDDTCAQAGTCEYVSVKASGLTATCGSFDSYDALLNAQSSGSNGNILRLRVVGGTAYATTKFSIDAHIFWVLAIDGNSVEPTKVT